MTSQQWPVKAQAARAIGTVATKLETNIQAETQARLVSLLLAGLEGRTWAGKESLMKSLADIVKSAPETLRAGMALEEQDKLVEVMLRESRKEKTEYKVVALESTGTVLKEMKLDRFKAIYEIVGGYLPKSEKKDEEEETEKDEDDAEGGARKLELQHSALVCVGLSWPENKDTAETFLPTVLDQLEILATNTTRRNQLALIKCLGNILKVWTVSEEQYSVLVFTKLAAMQFLSCIQVTFNLLFGTIGNSNTMLKMMAVQFVHQIIFHCPEQRLSPIGAVILSALTRLVNEEKENQKLRGSCYVAIGKLGLKLPSLVNKDVSMIQTFFEAMSTEDSDTQMSVQEALGLMAPAFRKIEPANLKFIEAIVATYMEKEEKQVRLVAVQYAGEVFGHDNVASRYSLLIGAGDIKDEVARASHVALYSGLKMKANNPDGSKRKRAVVELGPVLPDFLEMLMIVIDKSNIRAKSSFKVVVGEVTLPFTVAVGAEVCDYLRLCLWQSAGVLPSQDMLGEARHEAPRVARYLETLGKKKDLVCKFVDLVEKLLRASAGMSQALALLQFIATGPVEIRTRFVKRMDWFKFLLNNTREELRETIASIYSLVGASIPRPDFEKAVKDLTRSMKEKQLEFQHGALLALGYSFGRRNLLARMDKEELGDWSLYKETVGLIISQLDHSNSLIISAACLSLAELARCGPLPLTEEDKLSLLQRLLVLVKSSKTNIRLRERAALAAGSLCLGDCKFPHRRTLLESFIELASDIKDIELHFSIGEALVFCSLGVRSPAARDGWSVEEDDFSPLDTDLQEEEGQQLDWLVSQLTGRLTRSTHPSVKQAACLWLLAVVKQCISQSQVTIFRVCHWKLLSSGSFFVAISNSCSF